MIRRMEMSDVPAVVVLAKQMHEESRYSHLDFDPHKLIDTAAIILPADNFLTLVAIKNDYPIGFAVAYVQEHFFGHDMTSGDYAIYVEPESRGGMAGARLVKEYVKWAKAMGVAEPMLGVSAGINSDMVDKLYTRLGFTEKATIYRMPS